MRNALEDILKLAVDQPLIASGLAVVFLLILVLGVMHFIRIFGRFLVVLIQEFKHELLGIGKVFGRVRHELRSWRSDE